MVAAKKWLTWTTIVVFFLSGGIEYSVILPTCWDYLHKQFGARKWLYSLTLSAMSISNLIMGPLVGAIYDKTHQTKLLVLFLNLFEIGGNFLYFAAATEYSILISRFLTGIGWSAGTVIFGDLARTSLKSERATIYSVVMSARQFGIVAGPALNVIFRKFHFKLWRYTVNNYTLPGLFMTVVWSLIELMFLFAFFQQPPLGEQEEQHETLKKDKGQNNEAQAHFSRHTINTEATPLLIQSNKLTGIKSIIHHCLCKKLRDLLWMISSLIYEEIVLLLTLFYVILFVDWAMQAGFVPMAESILGWTDFENSIFFAAQAGINILSLLLVLMLHRKTNRPDVYFVLFGVTIELLAVVWFLGFFGRGHTSSDSHGLNIFEFTLSFALIPIALPFSWVVGCSLYSKFLPIDIQGFGQGVRRSCESLAAIIGPLWAGTLSDTNPNYYLFLSLPTFLLLVVMLLLVLSFTRLKFQTPV